MSKPNYHNEFEDFDEKFFEEPAELFSSGNEFNENYNTVKTTSTYHIQQAEQALNRLKSVVKDSDWKKVLEIKTDYAVYGKDETNDQAPMYMSKHVIEGFSPQSIFAVIGMRKLWDPWYEEGHLIENLDETTSLTYMVMQALAGTRSRDLSLVEKIEYTSNGTIYFASTSVETPKVRRSDKIRAHIHLNGWIIKPISKSPSRTRITYVLQCQVGGWVPSAVSRKYLTKRPLIIYSIDQYLRKNGPPTIPAMAVGSTSTSSHPSRSTSVSSVPSYTGHSIEHSRVNGYKTGPNKKLPYSQNIPNIIPVQPLPRVPIHDIASENSFNSDDEIDDTFDQKQPIFPRQPSTRSQVQPHYTTVPNSTPNLNRIPSIESIIPTKGQSVPSVPSSSVHSTSPVSPVTSVRSSTSTKSHMKKTPIPPKSPKPIKHRFTEVINKAFVIYKKNATNMKDWYFYGESKGVKIYMKDVEGRSTPIIRGEYTLDGSFTADDFLSVIRNMSLRKLWDDRFDDGEIIENFGNDAELVRLATKGTFPVSGRDFVYFAQVERDLETGAILNVSVSVDEPAVPEVKKYVRGILSFAGWQMVPTFDSNGNTKSIKIVYIVDIDLKLDIVPSSILKSISTGTPLVMQKIDEFLQKVGFPPYVSKTSSLILTSNLDPKTFQYDLSLDIKEESSVTEIRFSRTMYPNGFDMTVIPEGTKVELLPNNSDIIRMTLPSQVSSGKLKIKITKHTTKGVKMTYNGTNKIPLAPKGETISRKKPSILEKVMAEPVRTRDLETIRNENFAEHYSPQPEEYIPFTYPTSANNSISSANATPVGTINLNMLNNYTINAKSKEKQVMYEQVMDEKQVMYEQVTEEKQVMDEGPVVDKRHAMYERQVANEKQEVDERQLVVENERQVMDERPVVNKRHVIYERQVTNEKQEADERQLVVENERQVMDERKVVDKRQVLYERQVMDEKQVVDERQLVMTNERQVMDNKQVIVEESKPLTNKFEERNVRDVRERNNISRNSISRNSISRNSISVRMSYFQARNNEDIIILSDRMRFNSQQAGFMFAAMLLSYYAGKYSLY